MGLTGLITQHVHAPCEWKGKNSTNMSDAQKMVRDESEVKFHHAGY